jgi:hypothetical protein
VVLEEVVEIAHRVVKPVEPIEMMKIALLKLRLKNPKKINITKLIQIQIKFYL